jgi:hypothetical protein
VAAGEPILLVYDKQCPACDFYCKLARIRADVGNLKLVDARDSGPVMEEIIQSGARHRPRHGPEGRPATLLRW